MNNLAKKTKQLVVLSGKGGTGKTSITAAIAQLITKKKTRKFVVMVDADVDAANLSLIIRPINGITNEFWGGSLAQIDEGLCANCGSCVSVCRYDAILPPGDPNPTYWIDPIACDGCAACMYACPAGAIQMVQQQEGTWFHSLTKYGQLFHAELFPGRENSGKLVTLVRQNARLYAEEHDSGLIIIDGPPGIGCPVISACAGVDLGLIVTEPSVSGLHDMKRILGTLEHFHIPAVICINKADIYPQGRQQIFDFAASKGIPIVGEVPYDVSIPRSMLVGKPVTEEYPDADSAKSIMKLWKNLESLIF